MLLSLRVINNARASMHIAILLQLFSFLVSSWMWPSLECWHLKDIFVDNFFLFTWKYGIYKWGWPTWTRWDLKFKLFIENCIVSFFGVVIKTQLTFVITSFKNCIDENKSHGNLLWNGNLFMCYHLLWIDSTCKVWSVSKKKKMFKKIFLVLWPILIVLL